MHSARTGLATAVIVLCSVVAGGCGEQKASVSGKVEYDGKPLNGGSVVFKYENGAGFPATILEDGSYAFVDLPFGEVKIGVQVYGPNRRRNLSPVEHKVPKDLPPERQKEIQRDLEKKSFVEVPASYGDPAKSGLTFTVNPGKHTFDIRLARKDEPKLAETQKTDSANLKSKDQRKGKGRKK